MNPKVKASLLKLAPAILTSIKHKFFLFLLNLSDSKINTSKLILDLYGNYSKKKTKKVLDIQKWKSSNILNTNDFKNLIQKISDGNETCHIICSGESVFETIDLIKPDSFSIGFNFSGLIYPNSQIYFMEIAKSSPDFIAKKTKILSKIAKNSQKQYLFWKNIAGGEVSYKVIKNLFPVENYYLLDYFLPEYQKRYKFINNICLEKVFNSNDIYIPQFCNSIVTLISLASKVFKRIILHGHDMGGKRFYESEKFCLPEYLSRNDLDILVNNVNSQSKVLHEGTDKSVENVRFIMSNIKNIAKEKNIELLNAKDIK